MPRDICPHCGDVMPRTHNHICPAIYNGMTPAERQDYLARLRGAQNTQTKPFQRTHER